MGAVFTPEDLFHLSRRARSLLHQFCSTGGRPSLTTCLCSSKAHGAPINGSVGAERSVAAASLLSHSALALLLPHSGAAASLLSHLALALLLRHSGAAASLFCHSAVAASLLSHSRSSRQSTVGSRNRTCLGRLFLCPSLRNMVTKATQRCRRRTRDATGRVEGVESHGSHGSHGTRASHGSHGSHRTRGSHGSHGMCASHRTRASTAPGVNRRAAPLTSSHVCGHSRNGHQLPLSQ